MTAPSEPTEKPLPTGWRGAVMPINTRAGDGREFLLADGDELQVRPLPLPLSAQKALAGGHDGSIVVGLITRAWIEDGNLWAEGPFDLEDPDARDWAAKVGRGTAGWVSSDLSDVAVEEVYLGPDGEEITEAEIKAYVEAEEAWCNGDQEGEQPVPPQVTATALRCPSWKLMGVTLVSSPAFETARIEPVFGDEFAPVHAQDALTAAAAQHSGAMIALIPSQEDAARLAVDGYEPANVLHTTLVFLGDATNWSPEQRDHLEAAVRGVGLAPMTGQVWGHAGFNPDSDEPCAVYLVEAEGITSLQSAVLCATEESGTFDLVPPQHECYVPHVTAGYGLDPAQLTETGPIRFDRLRVSFAGDDVRDIPLEPVTASLVAGAVVYDTEDFTIPEADELTHLTVTEDGRVYGHLGEYDSCHIGFKDICVNPPTSDTDYAYFHTGQIDTTDGPLTVGKITLGTGHAHQRASARAAAEHYDNTGATVAIVRCTDGIYGPWMSGRILPGVPDDRVDMLRLSDVSGDWRTVKRGSNDLELIAVLAVNVGGFQIPRSRALAASGMRSLIAAGVHQKFPRPTPEVQEVRRTIAVSGIDLTQISQRVAQRASQDRETRREAVAARLRSYRMEALAHRVDEFVGSQAANIKGGN